MKMIIKGSSKRILRLKKELKLRLRNDKLTCKIESDIVPEKITPKKAIKKPIKKRTTTKKKTNGNKTVRKRNKKTQKKN